MRQLPKRIECFPAAALAGIVFLAACTPLKNGRIATPTISAATPKQATVPVPASRTQVGAIAAANPNAFNILLRPLHKRHLPPWKDSFHDPNDPAVHLLQAPMAAFANLPKTPSGAGNGIAWDKALAEGKIHPRWVLNNKKAKPTIFNMNIVFDVKGSMPNVVYPHKEHTEWLSCSNCHPSIFIPKRGANSVTMASILMGKQCGVCHGRVAFPVSACMRCHSGERKSSPIKENARP